MEQGTRMDSRQQPARFSLALLGGVVLASCGCVNLAANLIHAVTGNERPAEYDGLEGQRVAVVCSSDGKMGGEATDTILAGNIHAALSMNIDDIELVRHSEIEQWLDVHGWQNSDYVEIGKGVKADRLLAVELSGLKLKNGQTLFRGETDIAVTVYEIPSGKLLYRKQMPEFAFPQQGGKPITETSENKFRSFFLSIVTQEVAGLFYPVDATAHVARDAMLSRF